MARYHKKRTGFHETILKETEITKNGDNLIISSISVKDEKIKYCINAEDFTRFVDIIYRYAIEKETFSHLNVTELIEKEVYKLYKTKVASRNIPYVILNFLVKWEILYSDNGEDYFLTGNEYKFISMLSNNNLLECLSE